MLAGKPGNAATLAEAGRLFGRIAHLVDAAEDLAADQASGAWNPLAATATEVAEARRLCEDALLGIRLALDEAEFTDDRLVRALLVCELTRSVQRVFGAGGGARCGHGREHARGQAPAGRAPARQRPGLLAGVTALAGMLDVRHRCCPGCCADACCEGCGEGCCEACCSGCDCG